MSLGGVATGSPEGQAGIQGFLKEKGAVGRLGYYS